MSIPREHLVERDTGRLQSFAELVAELAAAPAPEHDFGHDFAATLAQVIRVIPATAATIAQYANDRLLIRATWGNGLNRVLGQALPPSAEPIWKAVATGEAYMGSSTRSEPSKSKHAHRYLAVPLIGNGQVQGVLEMSTQPPAAYNKTDLVQAQAIAALLGQRMSQACRMQALQAEVAKHERSVGRIAAQYTVTQLLSEASSFMDVADAILQTIGEQLRWDTGLMWCVQGDTNMLKCTAAWAADPLRVAQFVAASRKQSLAQGAGLPGIVWANQAPHWIPNVLIDPVFRRSVSAAQADLHTGFAFPIIGHNIFFGVIEFFTREVQTLDTELLQTTSALGRQMGQYIEQKRARNAQHESEQYTGAILQTALDGIIAMDHTGRITEWNPAAEEIFGHQRSEAIGQELGALIVPPALRDQHRRGMANYLATGQARALGRRLELMALRADGTEFPVELSIARVPSAGPPRFIGYTRDITEQKRAEAAIRFQAHLLDVVEQAVIATDTQGRITYWNRFAEKLYGWSAAETLGRNMLDITPAPGSQQQAEQVMDRLRTGESWMDEFVAQRRDGTLFPAMVIESPVFDAEGQVIGIVGVSYDISASKRAEQTQQYLVEASALLSTSLDFQQTFQQVADLAVPTLADWCTVDLREEDGTAKRMAVAHANAANVAIAHRLREQYPLDMEAEHGVPQVLRTGQSELITVLTDDVLQTVTQDAAHLQLIQSLGLVSAMIVPLCVRGRTIGAITLVSAQSGRRYDEADLTLAQNLASRAAMAIDNARLYNEARAAIKLRDEFLSIASHELKTPLTTMLGHSQALQRRTSRQQSFGERDQRALQVIVDQVLRLNRQIGTLLDVSRIELGQFQIDKSAVDLAALVRRVVAELEPTLERHTLHLDSAIDELVLVGDDRLLEQVLQNLLGNAVKYSTEGGKITVQLWADASDAWLSVSDQGIGIPQSAQPHLFQRFYRASNVNGDYISGLGIGLYLVHEIVSQHGGSISVTSTENVGSTFTVRLPRTQPTAV